MVIEIIVVIDNMETEIETWGEIIEI